MNHKDQLDALARMQVRVEEAAHLGGPEAGSLASLFFEEAVAAVVGAYREYADCRIQWSVARRDAIRGFPSDERTAEERTRQAEKFSHSVQEMARRAEELFQKTRAR